MQTFLPYADFTQSAKSLDWRRLGKQRVETFQILNVLTGVNTDAAWRNHSAVRMWRGHHEALSEYLDCCITEWVSRGYKNNMQLTGITGGIEPDWFGREDFHASHRSNLLRKDVAFYRQWGWTEPTDLPYVWPVD